MAKDEKPALRLKRLGIDTYREAVIYMRSDCYICESEGFEAQARVKVSIKDDYFIIATLNTIADGILEPGEVSLSEYAWELLGAEEGDQIIISHPEPLESFSYVRGKIYGKTFTSNQLNEIIRDVVAGRYSDILISSFLTACSGNNLNQTEIAMLTESMTNVGGRIVWPNKLVVDKHCVGGLPGNRTSLIVVPIAAAFGLTIPKTSSRAITSSAGTADTMETLAPVDLTFTEMQKVVEQEKGCIVWGGSVSLSPADDILIRVEKAIDLDSEGQLVASVLSKKISAGSNHILIDIPIGTTAKIRTEEQALMLKQYLESVGKKLGITVKVIFTDGSQPVGCGIGPSLEAYDVLSVLQGSSEAPSYFRDRALELAGEVLEFSSDVKTGTGKMLAQKILDSGDAWKKFQAICDAQGGMRVPPIAEFTHPLVAKKKGIVTAIDNRRIARVAKLAGAPQNKAAGVFLQVALNVEVEKGQPLFTIHAESKGELNYALAYADSDIEIVTIEDK